MSHICRIVQIAETSSRCVCERLRRVGDGSATYAMTWRRFCDDFCRTKKYYMFKTLAKRSRRVCIACKDLRYHANVSRLSATVWRIDSQTHRELVASQLDRGLTPRTQVRAPLGSLCCVLEQEIFTPPPPKKKYW